MSSNAKNQLLELLKNLGCKENCADFQSKLMSPSGFHESTVVVSLPGGRTVQGSGKGQRKTNADVAAAKDAIEQWSNDFPDLMVDWADIKVQAQAGDALIKLGAYLSTTTKSASDKSQYLQRFESNLHLAKLFDHWKAEGDPALAIWGDNLSDERKATLVEAQLWKRFGMQIISESASEQLQALVKMLVIE